MSFFRRLKAALAYARYMPRYVAPTDHEDAWNDEDAAAYGAFMTSPTGQKLKLHCSRLIYQSALNATQAHQTLQYQCGWASGVRATFFWLDQHLSRAAADSSNLEESAQDAADPFADWRP